MHSVKRILTTENRTCAIRPTAIQSFHLLSLWEITRGKFLQQIFFFKCFIKNNIIKLKPLIPTIRYLYTALLNCNSMYCIILCCMYNILRVQSE